MNKDLLELYSDYLLSSFTHVTVIGLAWIGQNRRMSKDYERKVQNSETFIEVAMIRLILRRLAGTA